MVNNDNNKIKILKKESGLSQDIWILAFFEHRNETTTTARIQGSFSLATLLTPF